MKASNSVGRVAIVAIDQEVCNIAMVGPTEQPTPNLSTAIFERRTLERRKIAEHIETAAEALAIFLDEVGRIFLRGFS